MDEAPEISSPPKSPKIHAAMAAIMADVGGVAKGRKNQQQGYQFRGIADLYLACQPVMAKHGVHVTPHKVLTDEFRECTTAKGGVIYRVRQRIEFRFWADDGSFTTVETTGEAMDTGDKASNKCMSAAMKYALIQAFAIPEDDPEMDTENAQLPEMAPSKQPEPKQEPKSEPHPAAVLWTEGRKLLQTEEPKVFWNWCSKMIGRHVSRASELKPAEITHLIDAARNGEVEPAGEAA